ncbi:MAG: hypothetical protein EOM73_16690 [Bacteroidia bacterium]|nr:hypothetical protein [Bacteroidia bacterium]
MGLEAGSVLETAIDEMLLQSYNGKIRVFPAIPKKWSGTFKLHAIGGFIVISEYKNSEVLYVAIESRKGERCCVINPWFPGEAVVVKELSNGRGIDFDGDCTIEFNTRPGEKYLITRAVKPLFSFEFTEITGDENRKPKHSGRAILGRGREF